MEHLHTKRPATTLVSTTSATRIGFAGRFFALRQNDRYGVRADTSTMTITLDRVVSMAGGTGCCSCFPVTQQN
jgi:hypothetical protein